jgi:hypothetical protein
MPRVARVGLREWARHQASDLGIRSVFGTARSYPDLMWRPRPSALARPGMATALAAASALLFAAAIPIAHTAHRLDIGNFLSTLLIVGPYAGVGMLVARRQPRNAVGWMMLLAGLFFVINVVCSVYAVLAYRVHHGHLLFGPVAVMLQPSWAPAIILLALQMLLFPDARLPLGRWRWVLWACLGIGTIWMIGAFSLAAHALAVGHVQVEPSGDLRALDHPTGSAAWWGISQNVFFSVLAIGIVASITRQTIAYRRSTGDRRLQLKWLLAGATVFAIGAPLAFVGSGSNTVLNVVSTVGTAALSALPVSIGIAILRYRLFDIDRLISRTVSYAALTATLVVFYGGLITLTTQALPLSSPIGVAASTLAAIAAVNPLRRRVQRAVDRRFNRANYDAARTVARFSVELRNTIELDRVQRQLVDVVTSVVQPTHMSIWTKPTAN